MFLIIDSSLFLTNLNMPLVVICPKINSENINTCGGFSFSFNPDVFLRVPFKLKFTYFEDRFSPFPKKGFFRSDGKYQCLQLYTLEVIGSVNHHLCTC